MEQPEATPITEQAQASVRTLPTLRVTVLINELQLSDILLLDDVGQGREYNLIEVVRLLDRVIEGGVQGRPLNQFKPLLGRLLTIVQELANPKSEG